MLQKAGAHADAGILHHKLIFAVLLEIKLPRFQPDAVAGVAVLDGVGQQVVDDLGDLFAVAHHPGVGQVQAVGKGFPRRLGLVVEDLGVVFQQFLQVKLGLLQVILAGLHPGQLQNVVDEGQQLIARKINLADIILHFGGVAAFLALLGQAAVADDGVQRGAHIVGHAVEEVGLGLGALAGRLQSVLQQNHVLHLLAAFGVHIPEAEGDLILCNVLVVQGADIHPAVGIPEPALIVAAVVGDALVHPALDFGQGKALLKLLIGAELDKLADVLHQLAVAAPLGQGRALVLLELDGLIALFFKVHPEDGIEGILQHMDGVIRLFHPVILDGIPDGQRSQQDKHHCRNEGDDVDEHVLLTQQNQVEGDGHNDHPAVAHLMEIGAPLVPHIVGKGGVVFQQRAVLDAFQQIPGIFPVIALVPLPGGLGINQLAVPGAEVIGIFLRHGQRRIVEGGIFDVDIHRHHIPRRLQRLGNGHHQLAGDGVGIDLAAHHFAPGLDGLGIPFGGAKVAVVIP